MVDLVNIGSIFDFAMGPVQEMPQPTTILHINHCSSGIFHGSPRSRRLCLPSACAGRNVLGVVLRQATRSRRLVIISQ